VLPLNFDGVGVRLIDLSCATFSLSLPDLADPRRPRSMTDYA